MVSWDGIEGTFDGTVAWFLDSFVVGKFYRLFAFMFGVGFALQMGRLEERGTTFVPLYVRRLLILLIIGLLHGIFLWPNDILALFAQLGFLLLIIRNVSNRVLVVIGLVGLFAAPTYYYVATDFADFRGTSSTSWNEERNQSAKIAEREMYRVRSEGSYRDVVAFSSDYYLNWQTDIWTHMQIFREEFLMLLIGFYIGRRRVFERVGQDFADVRHIAVIALAVGLIGFPVISWLAGLEAHPNHGHLAVTARMALLAAQSAAFSLLYGLAFLLMVERFKLHRHLRYIANVGRMTLTSYLVLSIVISMTFYEFGLNLFGRVSVFAGLAMAVTSYVLFAAGSTWWLRRFRFGPVEWFWRSLTYASMQPMKIDQSRT